MRKVVLILILLPVLASASGEKLAFIYYYGWYGNPDADGQWLHWEDYGHNPPRDVSSAYYPKLGPYSSRDAAVLEQHMRWIAGANINVIIYSWWGKGDPTDAGVRPLLDMAADYTLKVAFLIEPYPGRSTHSICDDIEYLAEKYGSHPAFFRMSRKTATATSAPRGVFFVYQPDFYSDEELKQLSTRIHDSPGDPMLLLQTTDTALAERTGVDGMFAYEAYQNLQHFYAGLVASAKEADLIFIPCVSPGFNINRTFHAQSDIYRPRRFGRTYDDWWEKVVAADADYVAIVSFNEWHEGTEIEPAVRWIFPPLGYLSFEGAYRKNGEAAEQSYLRRTARWIQLFQTGSW